jgi:hypothetical protein
MTKEKAIAMAESGWWKDLDSIDIVSFQLFEERLCMDFGDFQLALEDALGRPVFTHELGLNVEGIKQEFLGKKPKATFEEILNLIPEEKRVVIVAT